MGSNSTAADAPDDVVVGDDDDDDDDEIDNAYNAHRRRSLARRRRRDLDARRHVLASFAILAAEWIRTYVPILRAVATKLKRMYDSPNDRSSGESNRWSACADGGGGSAVALGRPSSDWGTTADGGDTAGNGRSSRFALRFEVKGRTRPNPPTPPLSISTPSTRRPRVVDAGQILTRLEGRKSSSSILFASDGTKAKAPMEILNSPRMMSRLREGGDKDDD